MINNNYIRMQSVKEEVNLLRPIILELSDIDDDGVFICTTDLKKIIEENIGVYDSRSVNNRIRKLVNEGIIAGGINLDKYGKYTHYNIIVSEKELKWKQKQDAIIMDGLRLHGAFYYKENVDQ